MAETEGEGGADGDGFRWEKLNDGVEFECPAFLVRRDDVRYPDGTLADYHYLSEPPTAVVLPFTTEGEVVTRTEWRQSVERVGRGLPRAPIGEGAEEEETGEDPVDAAERALAAAGYEATSVEHVGRFEPAADVTDSVHHHLTARGCEPAGEPETEEAVRVERVEYDRLLADAVDGRLHDGPTATAIFRHELTTR